MEENETELLLGSIEWFLRTMTIYSNLSQLKKRRKM